MPDQGVAPELDGFVRVHGASEHNLRGVHLAAPRNAMVVFTGVSGSGKSSLAFGTIYAEAQRRYFESVAPYARRLLHQAGVPKVDDITGLPPAVALQQRRGAGSNPRSSVGTITALSNALRLLLSRAGTYPPTASDVLDAEWFSPNTAVGACPECHGTGMVHTTTAERLVPDPSLTIREGAIAAWPGAWQGQNLRDILVTLGYDVDVAWRELPERQRDWILFTDEQPTVAIGREHAAVDARDTYNGTFTSADRYVRHTFAHTQSAAIRKRVAKFVEVVDCPACGGARLRPEALAVTFAGATIAELYELPLDELAAKLAPTAAIAEPDAAHTSTASGENTDVAVMIARDICARLEVLNHLGLDYLSLRRPASTLSPGEIQRLRIATQLRAGLFGVLYVLDEPSAGLHPADRQALMSVLQDLKAAGNSVFVIEHDIDLVRQADWVVDVGPGAGEHGGEVLFSGPVAGLADVRESVTRRYLFGGRERVRAADAVRTPTGWLNLRNVRHRNLVDVAVDVPVGVLTAVTGVAGSGKSTLVAQVLAGVVREALGLERTARQDGAAAEELDANPDDATAGVEAHGLAQIARLVCVDQKPIGRTPRSNLATYTGMFDSIRRLFAETDDARARGWDAGRFSFNVPGGRCDTCQGEGFVAVELMFLPGTYAACPTCGGHRYNAETLAVRWHGRSVADILAMTVSAARGVLAEVPAAARSLATLEEVGLGYLRLGQPATELSGGEAQRVKIAAELQRARRGGALYVLDEPTTGLHPADVEVLLTQLHRLVDAGNTVVVAEHDLDVVASSDWVIDLGPGAGTRGGTIVATGPPAVIADSARSCLAPYLTRHLDGMAVPGSYRHGPVLAAGAREAAHQAIVPPTGA